jgi:hypothetical protein
VNPVAWNAASQLDTLLLVTVSAPTPWFSARKIVTMNSQTSTVVPFLWANLSATQKDSLAPGKPAARQQMILEFLRGNRAKEGAKLGQFSQKWPSALGDFVTPRGLCRVPSAPYRERRSAIPAFVDLRQPRRADRRRRERQHAARVRRYNR